MASHAPTPPPPPPKTPTSSTYPIFTSTPRPHSTAYAYQPEQEAPPPPPPPRPQSGAYSSPYRHDQAQPPLPPHPSQVAGRVQEVPARISSVGQGYGQTRSSGEPERNAQGYEGGGAEQQVQQKTTEAAPAEAQRNDLDLVPEFVKDMSKTDLQYLLAHPELLHALIHSPTTAPPVLTNTNADLLARLSHVTTLASKVSAQHASLQQLRSNTSAHLLRVRALEQTWRKKEKEMEARLEKFGPRELRGRLVASIQEQEGICKAVEEGWIDDAGGQGVAGEREVVEWLKRVREGRKILALRVERRRRWDEGRVGGWR